MSALWTVTNPKITKQQDFAISDWTIKMFNYFWIFPNSFHIVQILQWTFSSKLRRETFKNLLKSLTNFALFLPNGNDFKSFSTCYLLGGCEKLIQGDFVLPSMLKHVSVIVLGRKTNKSLVVLLNRICRFFKLGFCRQSLISAGRNDWLKLGELLNLVEHISNGNKTRQFSLRRLWYPGSSISKRRASFLTHPGYNEVPILTRWKRSFSIL